MKKAELLRIVKLETNEFKESMVKMLSTTTAGLAQAFKLIKDLEARLDKSDGIREEVYAEIDRIKADMDKLK